MVGLGAVPYRLSQFSRCEFGVRDEKERLKYYRRFVYEMGSISGVKKERQKDFELGGIDTFRSRTRYFTDSGIIVSNGICA